MKKHINIFILAALLILLTGCSRPAANCHIVATTGPVNQLTRELCHGTDLTVTLTPYSKFGHDAPADAIRFQANIPTEEICTSPEKFGTDGVIYASRPLVLGGKSIENFGFRFENG